MLLAVGEAKWHEAMGIGHLERLRHIRSLLTAQGRHGAATARLLCFSGAGFTAELAEETARSGDIRLLSPADLYTGVLLPAGGQRRVQSSGIVDAASRSAIAPLRMRRARGVRRKRWSAAPKASQGRQLGRATSVNRTAKMAA